MEVAARKETEEGWSVGGPERAVKKGMQGQKRRERRPEKDRGASLGFSSCGLDKSGGSVVEAEPQ